MDVLLSIGDFSRMTYLGVKALRHYHEIGLLEPADIDAETGYRRYLPAQVQTAQVIRRLRDLGMPLEDVKAVLEAPDLASRNAGIAAHLRRMERYLEQAQATVTSLRHLLEEQPPPIEVMYRSTVPCRALLLSDRISMGDAEQWWGAAFDKLRATLAATSAQRAGADGALYSPEFFQSDVGEVTAFIPVDRDPHPARTAQVAQLPGAELAVAVHQGPFGDLDKTYGALGTFVAERAIGLDGPIRENYLVSPYDTADEVRHQAEVCWPVFRTTTRTG
jgi:DNA-binding transcriptional MerR regulator